MIPGFAWYYVIRTVTEAMLRWLFSSSDDTSVYETITIGSLISQKAIESPRFHCKHDRIYVESRIPENGRRGLRRMGHKVIVRKRSWPFRGYDLFYGGVQAILCDRKTSKVYGGADPRKNGAARGY